jgi:ComF family protein
MWTLTLKNLVFPIFCKECGNRLMTNENGFFCPTCWELPTRIKPPFCSVCGKPHPRVIGFSIPDNYPCADCNNAPPERPCRHIFGATLYEGATAEAVKILKFHERKWILRPMAEELQEFVTTTLDTQHYTVLTPVPLHPVRLRDRGFNQALLLTESIADLFPNASLSTALKRIRPTRTQSRLNDPQDRQDNVRGAFAVDQQTDFTDHRILLIDDVVTTGRTVTECARALHRAGAKHVDVLAFALTSK